MSFYLSVIFMIIKGQSTQARNLSHVRANVQRDFSFLFVNKETVLGETQVNWTGISNP